MAVYEYIFLTLYLCLQNKTIGDSLISNDSLLFLLTTFFPLKFPTASSVA